MYCFKTNFHSLYALEEKAMQLSKCRTFFKEVLHSAPRMLLHVEAQMSSKWSKTC